MVCVWHAWQQRPQLESLKLGQAVRNSVQDAVESLGGRVTVGDVAARAGVKISEAEEALNALAADSSGTLEVNLLHTAASRVPRVYECLHTECNRAGKCRCHTAHADDLTCLRSHGCHHETHAFLATQVSDSGDVLYVLPNNFKQIIAGKSWLLRAEPFLQKVRDASAYLVRVTFGTALITSVILVWVTIVAILSSSGKDDDRR